VAHAARELAVELPRAVRNTNSRLMKAATDPSSAKDRLAKSRDFMNNLVSLSEGLLPSSNTRTDVRKALRLLQQNAPVSEKKDEHTAMNALFRYNKARGLTAPQHDVDLAEATDIIVGITDEIALAVGPDGHVASLKSILETLTPAVSNLTK